VDNCVDRYNYALLEDGTVENRGTSRNKHAAVDRGASDMCMRADQDMTSERARILARASEHRILHHDAVLSNAHWRPLGSYDRTG
jgi:hypothetical protein